MDHRVRATPPDQRTCLSRSSFTATNSSEATDSGDPEAPGSEASCVACVHVGTGVA